MDVDRLSELLKRFPSITLAVVGDFFLDKYLVIDQMLSESSLETGLEAYQVVEVRQSPGAAGTVTSNLCALGVNAIAVGVLGDDGEGVELERRLLATGVDASQLVRQIGYFTPTYTKPMLRAGDGSERELSRLDIKNRKPLRRVTEDEIIKRLSAVLPYVQGVVVVDQVEQADCGVVTTCVREAIGALAEQHPEKTFAVESRSRIGLFRRIVLKPNVREALGAISEAPGRSADIHSCVQELSRRSLAPVFMTRGGEGILLCDEEGPIQVQTLRVRGPIDTVGAGDSALAGIAASLCAGSTRREAALVGNLAASVTIRQIGTTGTANQQQVLDAFSEFLAEC